MRFNRDTVYDGKACFTFSVRLVVVSAALRFSIPHGLTMGTIFRSVVFAEKPGDGRHG